MAAIRPSGVYSVTYQEDIALVRTPTDRFWLYLLLGVLILIPLLTSESPLFASNAPISTAVVGTMTRIGIFIIAITGLNILLGYTGQISLGHAAFVMVGAYSSHVFVDQFGIPFWFALPMAALFTGLVGVLFGLPALRVRGFYLAMATLAAQYIIPWFIKEFHYDFIDLGGSTGKAVSAPELFGTRFTSNLSMYYVVLVVTIIGVIAARNITRSRVGRALISVRDNDLAAEQLGINVFQYKLIAFFIASVYAGVAGSLTAHNSQQISPDAFNIQDSINYLGMLIIGGLGFPLGVIFGVSFFFVMQDFIIPAIRPYLQDQLPTLFPFIEQANIDPALLPLMFGITLVLFLIFEPRGLAYRWEIIKASWQLRPFSQT